MQIPARLGKYEIRREIGRGAMGIVYEGYDPSIGRRIAIKILQQDLSGGTLADEIRLRFRREAQAAGQLNHPNIVAVYEYGDDAGSGGAPVPFIAMEFVEGQDLKALFTTNRRYTLPEIAHLMAQLLSALQHAHDHGVIHRDIKPANLILCDGGRLKLADLGIARIDNSDLTRTGTVMGTVSYMSPEQLTGDPVDRRTDIYACGVILYELLTGEPPFIGSTASIIQKVLNQEPLPPSTLNPALPRVLDEAVRRALAKRPAARFATADAFAQVIAAANARVADDDATIVRSAGSKPGGRRAWMSIAAALGVAVAAALAFVELRRPGPRAEGATAQSPSPASAPVVAAIPAPASQPPPTSPPDHAVAPVHIQSAEEIEQLAWDETRRADNAAAYAAYLKGYPDGRFSRLARIRLAALTPLPPAAHAELPRVPASAVAAPVSVATRPTETQPARKTTVAESGESRRGTDAPSPTKAADAAAASTPVAMAAAPPPLSRRAEAPEPVRRDADCAAKAEAGDLHCQFALGEAYRNGQGVGRDYALALRWYRKAADRGDPAAQFQVGMIYRAGLGVSRDVNEGARWVRKAADQGYAPAQNIVGSSHERGEGLASSMVLAADWYRKAADQGYAPGQNNLGRMYLFGRGVFKNAEKAASLFQLSAAQGDANAAYNLGFMNERGEGFPQSAERAASWYKTALARPNLNVTPTEREHAATFAATHP